MRNGIGAAAGSAPGPSPSGHNFPPIPPGLYRSANGFQRRDNIRALTELGRRLKKTANERPRCLDIGCACGDFTRDVLLERFEARSSVVAVDISSEMIAYAREHSPHPSITYDVLDIAEPDVSGFVEKYGGFERVYSFFCLHWVKDQAAAFRNIAAFLRGDGEYLLLFPVRADLYNVWRDLARLPRWKEHTRGIEGFISSSHDLSSADAAIQCVSTALETAGLIPETCQAMRSEWVFNTKQDMTETVMPLIPVVRSRLTEEENHDFHDDLSDILVKHCARGSLDFLVGADLCAVQGTKLSDRSIS